MSRCGVATQGVTASQPRKLSGLPKPSFLEHSRRSAVSLPFVGLANLLGRLVSAAGRKKFEYRIPNIKTNSNNQNSN
jgi:hypothetical protein